jgi:hypothetical protein
MACEPLRVGKRDNPFEKRAAEQRNGKEVNA